eukprot:s4442_g8.t1
MKSMAYQICSFCLRRDPGLHPKIKQRCTSRSTSQRRARGCPALSWGIPPPWITGSESKRRRFDCMVRSSRRSTRR